MASTGEPQGVWYFGYGSNMSPGIFCDRRGMRPCRAEPAVLADHRLCFNLPIGPGERGVANIAPEAGASTWGVIYLLSPDELERLDRTEGVSFGAYERVVVTVVTKDGRRVESHTYRSSRGCEGRKPSPRYIGLLLDGARHHGLPADYVLALEVLELARDARLDRIRSTAATSGDR